jgi:hypothetical protein
MSGEKTGSDYSADEDHQDEGQSVSQIKDIDTEV